MADGSTAFLFPGQGAQRVGMCSDAYEDSTVARALFAEADRVLGFDLSQLVLKGPAEELAHTRNAQPAIYVASLAYLWTAEQWLGEAMPQPTVMAGHSLGEYTALVAAGAISFAAGLRLVRRRGELMHTASESTPGGMSAVLGLDHEAVATICEEVGVQVANFNSPGQLVIAGSGEALERAEKAMRLAGAYRVIRLNVSGAFHSEVMRPAQAALDAALAETEVTASRIPIIANTTAAPVSQPNEVRSELSRQLCGSILWQSSVEYMVTLGVKRFIEFGPGRILAGLVRSNSTEAVVQSIGALDALESLAVS